ncbi:MAG: hypothetical protein JNJ61_25300 [Anaerolineae bacterium]|nr:hypothetical protein [Anaerolineae bacterium]
MMKRLLLSKTMKRLFRQGQTGQTIVILAFGFVVLLGFVGIVTDVSLLFVRYSTLRRAVDAAAVSAAGQMRRAAPTDEEEARAAAAAPGNPTEQERLANGYAYARNVANVNLAARQFIEFYGLNPSTVLVDSCDTIEDDPGGTEDVFDELRCGADENPRKLVKVTAQLDSPTVFLRLLGWGEVRLEASAISETAVIDVVMIFDASESMLNQTSYDDYGTNAVRYVPPRMNFAPNPALSAITAYNGDWKMMWQDILLNETQNSLMGIAGSTAPMYPVFGLQGFRADAANNTTVVTDWSAAGQAHPNCRVRFFPPANALEPIPNGLGGYDPSDDIRIELGRFLGITYPAKYDGFMPMYNWYGCCNDPNQDGRFNDLVCQPFREMRDRTEDFLGRIDFGRGDRVAFVTFDRGAYVVDPDGSGAAQPMMSSEEQAREALQDIVGVRAEPNFYADLNRDGLWDAYVVGRNPWDPANPNNGATMYSYDMNSTVRYNGATGAYDSTVGGWNNTPLGNLLDYPVKDNCYFLMAKMQYPFTTWSSPSLADARTPSSVPVNLVHPARALRQFLPPNYIAQRYPTALAAYGADTLMNPNLNDPAWDLIFPTIAGEGADARQARKSDYSYEMRAFCGGSNVGSGLRAARGALLNPQTSRLDGAVWVMVMLGDGAAGSSDPVLLGGASPIAGNPYGDPNSAPAPFSDYGAYGVCPWGDPGARAGLVDGEPTNPTDMTKWDVRVPRCQDTIPETRLDACFNPNNDFPVDIPNAADDDCFQRYDVDDFARHWADAIALPREDGFPNVTVAGTTPPNEQLPIIFTIGFGLDFQISPNDCVTNIGDCLGEELLRYVADVGDNNRIDTDYLQDLKDDTFLNGSVDDAEWGDRGPCENPIIVPAGQTWESPADIPDDQVGNYIINPIAEGRSCGNYYNAPSATQLQIVFDDIASRMFTRLTR